MPSVQFTSHLRQVAPTGTITVGGATLRAALDDIFSAHPQLKSYVLDDQERLRKHVVIYVNQQPVRDRYRLSDPVAGADEIFVFQALTGG